MDEEQNKKWQCELGAYLKQGEPSRSEKSAAWQTAIGLQAVDGLKTSDYLLQTAKEHIEGNIDFPIAKKRIHNYYEMRKERLAKEENTREADIVSVRITEILSEKTFQFSPVELQAVHHRLFKGILPHAGQFRTYNISKKEWVLNGESVLYSSADTIPETLTYDFSQEKKFSYALLPVPEAVRHIARFVSDVWQIHPFGEGNTRTTAVFMIKYLTTFGFQVKNDVFAENSWYFRNALVRANYNNLQKKIYSTTEFLEFFFENLLLGTQHELKNRFLHVEFSNQNIAESAISSDPKCNSCTMDCTLEETAILREIAKNPKITQEELARKIGKSERTVKSRTVDLQKKGWIERENGKRNGHWKLLRGPQP